MGSMEEYGGSMEGVWRSTEEYGRVWRSMEEYGGNMGSGDVINQDQPHLKLETKKRAKKFVFC